MQQRRTNIQHRRTTLILLTVAGLLLILPSPAFCSASKEPCADNPQSRQLDFWLGDWRIGAPGSSSGSNSKVYATLDKCLVVEDWDGGRGHRGENFFAYSPDDKSWHGMFVDNQGRMHVFLDGKVDSGTAEFSGPSVGEDGKTALNRVKIVRVGPNKVEQLWQKSADNGATWSTEFRGEYTRKNP